RGPFPDVAEHLAAAGSAVSFREFADGNAARSAQISGGAARRRCSHLPLRLARQTPARIATKGVRLVPVDVHDREIAVKRHLLVKAALAPLSVALDPVARGLHPALPAPAF